MLKAIIVFEVKNRLKRLSSLSYFLIFFAISFLVILIAGGGIKGFNASFGIADKVYLNSPYALNSFITIFVGFFGMLIVAPLFGQVIYQDFYCRMDQILFSCPMKRKNYLLGRFLGAVISCIIIFSGAAFGFWLATLTPWVQKEVFTENKLIHYLFPYLTGVIPNILIFGSFFFALVCRFRKMAPVYISGILLLVVYMIAGTLVQDIDRKLLASLLDPFGRQALSYLTEYWSSEEKNTTLITWNHFYLYNRLLWLSIGILPLIYTLFRFRYSGNQSGKRVKQKESQFISEDSQSKTTLSPVSMEFGFPSQIKSLFHLSFFELRQAFKNIYFLMIYLFGVVFLFITASQIGKLYGTPTLPVTYMVLEGLTGGFGLFMLILIAYYSGELIWRERGLKFHLVSDALPRSNSISLLSKIVCLGLLQMVLLGTILFCGILVQSFKGYFHFELGLYLKHLFGIQFISWFLISLLALFIHTVASNKYLGHFIVILCYMGMSWLPFLGFEHNLYRYGAIPAVTYSDMNGFGPFLKGFTWFSIYWLLFSIILIHLAYLLWPRGTVLTNKLRFLELKRRLTRPVLISLLFFCIITGSVGGFIYYNTNILNIYMTEKERNQLKHVYESKYKQFEKLPEPELKKVTLEVDIFPYQKKMKAKGHLLFRNKTTSSIQTLFVHHPIQFVEEFSMEWSQPVSLSEKNNDLSLSIYKLKKPLLPGKKLSLKFQVTISYPGFQNGGVNTDIVSNGTFFLKNYFPSLGYRALAELNGDKIRRKYKLKPKPRMPKIDDQWAKQHSALGSSRVEFSAVVSTSQDQIAIAPGYLQKEWQEGGRRYFHYKAEQPIWDLYAFVSGRYAVKKDKWKDVSIEIYYHPTHTRNLDRMIRAVKKGLEYFTKEFSPYQHKQFRIIEFPRYHAVAISLPNTIPFSEAIGFIADVKDEKETDIDYPFYVTAHELAHQWWGHQVTGASVQGAHMLSESLSQYAALMVMEKEYTPYKMKRFLKHELNRYLIGRSGEHKLELPIMLTETQQYIYYSKGSLIMYALQDYAGEKALNSALRKYIRKTAWQTAPYTTTKEFVRTLKDNLPKKVHNLIDDFFKYITFYDNRTLKASAKKKSDGEYVVTLTTSSKKWRSDGLGKQTEKLMDIPVDIGIRNKKGDFIYLKKHTVNQQGKYEVTVNDRPHKAGIDPLNKLIDRKPDDNEILVKFSDNPL